MQRSYLVKSPVHFADLGFFVKVGDILVHDTSNANRLTVYRNGEVVKAVKQTALGLAAMQKNGFIDEVVQQAPKTVAKAPAKPVEVPKPVSKKEEPKPAPKPAPAPPKKKEEPKPKLESEPPKSVPKPIFEDEDDEIPADA